MKKVLIVIAALVLGACGSKQPTTRTAARGTNGQNVGVNGNVGATYALSSSWTAVTGYTQQAVADLVSTNPDIELGNIDPNTNCRTLNGQSCAVIFNVAANPSSQTTTSPLALNTSSGNGSYPTTGPGWLTIAIYDSKTGNGTSAIAVAVPLSGGVFVYNGSTGFAYVNFGDDAGTITVGTKAAATSQNNIQGQSFSDVIGFQNATGSNPGLPEPLGNFTTNVCGIFQCY